MRGRVRVESPDEFWPAYTDILMVTALILVLLVVTFVISRQDNSVQNELDRRKQAFQKAFNERLAPEAKAGHITLISPPGERQTITFSDQLLFDLGDARITRPDGKVALTKVSSLLKSLGPLYKSIQVNGHTDEDPISTPQYPSNWHLSSARATSVVYYFVGQGLPPTLFSATGYAEFRPLDPNGNRIASKPRKRRIEIEVLYPLDWIGQQLSAKKP